MASNGSNMFLEEKVISNKQFECHICKCKYTTKKYLKIHIRFTHEGKGVTCDICDAIFPRNTTLTKHKSSVHEGKKHKCDVCDKDFASKSGLVMHLKEVHEGKNLSIQDSSNVHEEEKLDQVKPPNTTFKDT